MAISSWNAGIIRPVPVAPAGPYETGAATGVWTLEQQAFWQKQGLWPISGNIAPDAQFNYVTMLLHGDGTNGAQNNTFLDSSTNNFTVTRTGNTTQGSFSPYGSNWSNAFDGTGDYISTAVNSANLGTGDFNITFWINLTSAPSNGVPATNVYNAGAFTNGWYFYTGVGTDLSFGLGSAGGADAVTATVNLIGAWHYIEVTRSGSTLSIYVDGVFATSKTNTKTGTVSGNSTIIGSRYDGTSGYITGYISNFKVVVGTAGNTANYTPPTAPATATTNTTLLTCQSNRFIDNSTNNFAITKFGDSSVQRFSPFGVTTAYSTTVTGGSGYFDGTGDYLTIPSSTAFDMGSGDFTIEGWFYSTNTSGGSPRVITNRARTGGNCWSIQTDGSRLEVFAQATTVYSVAGAVRTNTWYHFALERNGANFEFYLNGVRASQVAAATLSSSTSVVYIGADATYTLWNGYITDFRIVKGSAVYSGATYTVPTAPLTAITNTQLLLNTINGAIFDNAMINNLETVGNAQISTSVKKFGTGSLAFDGTGDNLYTINSAIPPTAEFTLEMWIYPTSTSGYQLIYSQYISGNSGNFQLLWNDTASRFTVNDGSGLFLTSSSTYSTNAWYHLAIVRSGSTFTMYVNGTSVASGTNSYSILQSASYIGTRSALDGYFNGYIDDLRITKGYARYTANFTPPTVAFSNYGPT